MAHDLETKALLRKRYCFDRLSLEQVAQQCQVSYPTAKRWKSEAKAQGDDWDKVRGAHTIAGGELEDLARQLLTDLVLQYKSTMQLLQSEELPAKERVQLLASLSDGYHKAIAANKKLMPETSKLAVALQVLELLAEYLKNHKPELLPPFMDILSPFGQQLDQALT